MHVWARWLAEAPPTLLRAIARVNRVSLPRGCTPAERVARLRASLCRAATVRSAFFGLSAEAQAAAQELAAAPGAHSDEALAARFGPLRPLAELARDPLPRSLHEQLVLLGWLLPRPAEPRHPACWRMPPEARVALPRPLSLRDDGLAPLPPMVPAVRAANTLLLASAEAPLPLRTDGMLSAAALHRLVPRLAPMPRATALLGFVLPLLIDMGLVAPHGTAAALAPAGRRWLRRPHDAQVALLRGAWERASHADAWLTPLRVTQRGLDWPVLRRRLVAWATTLPAGRLLAPQGLADALAASLGPLADAQTHGRCSHRRTPWLAQRADAVWLAALRGPLAWLGYVAWTPSGAHLFRAALSEAAPSPWHSSAAGEVGVPHDAVDTDLLTLLPFLRWQAADATTTSYQLHGQRVAAATRHGHSSDSALRLLRKRLGATPSWLAMLLGGDAPTVQIVHGTLVLSDDPAILDQALRHRSTRRAVTARLAPGIALVAPERMPQLTRALEQQHLAASVALPPTVAPPEDWTPAECAVLLAACQAYREQHAGVSHEPLLGLETRLRGVLPPTLRTPSAEREPLPQPAEPFDTTGHDPASLLPQLRRAIERRQQVHLRYCDAQGQWSERTVRPLRLEQHGACWHLHAHCQLVRDERLFRVDRIAALLAPTATKSAPAPEEPRRPPTAPRSSSPATPRLTRVWLDD